MEQSSGSNRLIIQNLYKSYRRKEVLRGLSLTAGQGTCTGLLGENGCGKSTLLSITAGLVRPDRGEVAFGGHNLLREASYRSQTVGYVPQGTPLFEELTALDHLKFWYCASGRDLKKDLTEGVPALLGVDEFLDVKVSRMSGGMKKRLSIACCVSSLPEILLMDEPSASLDLACKEKICSFINYMKGQGRIILLATHDLQEIPVCDSCYILKNGVLNPYTFDGNVHTLVGQL